MKDMLKELLFPPMPTMPTEVPIPGQSGKPLSPAMTVWYTIIGTVCLLGGCCIWSGALTPGKLVGAFSSSNKMQDLGVTRNQIENAFQDLGFGFQSDPELFRGFPSSHGWSSDRSLEVQLVGPPDGLLYVTGTFHCSMRQFTSAEQVVAFAVLTNVIHKTNPDSGDINETIKWLHNEIVRITNGPAQSERLTPHARIRVSRKLNPCELSVSIQSRDW